MSKTQSNDKSTTAKNQANQKLLSLPIANIVIDPSVNVRHEALDADTIENYSENPALPPVQIMLVDGKHLLVDGEHRLQGAVRRGDKTINVIVVGTGSLSDAQDYADLANLAHGRPLTRQQKQHVCRRLHMRHPEWSNRELARKLSVTHPTIREWLEPSTEVGKNLPLQKGAPKGADETPTIEPPINGGSDGDPVSEKTSMSSFPAAETNSPHSMTIDDEYTSFPQGESAKPKSSTPVTTSAPVTIDAEYESFAERFFIELATLNAKRGANPLTKAVADKLNNLANLITQTTKETK